MGKLDQSGTPTSDTVVELEAVHKSFKQRIRADSIVQSLKRFWSPEFRTVEALNGVDLKIHRGEIVAYAGPNGAGKSTTIKLLSGLLIPDEGRVRCLGADPSHDRVSYVQRIAVVFGQRTELWWDYSVAASFHWKKAVWGIDEATYDRMLESLWESFALDEIWGTLARELSLGQRMRADLALAMLHDPDLILLDEPTLGLDVLARQRMLNWILELNRTANKTIVVTSHSMADIEALEARVVMLVKGKLGFDGDFSALRARVGDTRRLNLWGEMLGDPEEVDARLTVVRSSAGHVEFSFSPDVLPVVEAIEIVGQAIKISDMTISESPIDDVVTKMYEEFSPSGNPKE